MSDRRLSAASIASPPAERFKTELEALLICPSAGVKGKEEAPAIAIELSISCEQQQLAILGE